MNHISKFIEYLIESNDVSDDDINDFLYPIIENLGIPCVVSKPVVITEGKYAGREYRKIDFDISKLKCLSGLGYADALVDDRIWELFSEIITLKNRLNSDEVLFSMNSIRKRMGISFITNSDVKKGVGFELERLYRKIYNRSNEGKSDFYYNMTMNLDKENLKININCSMAYSDRKWRLFSRDIDLSGYDVDIKTYDKYDELSANIIITPKK